MRTLLARTILAGIVTLLAHAPRAHAIGWDSDDFLITGGPQAPSQIGVFDHDLTFKGFLEPGWSRGGGWDFDAAGNFVANSAGHREVRVYSPSGTIVGGFFDNRLAPGGDLRVMPNGDYVVGQSDDFGGVGIMQFHPSGAFVRQIGAGTLPSVDLVGNQLWAGRLGNPQVRVFDFASGVEQAPLTVTGLSGVQAIHYSASTNTVLFGHSNAGRILETDLSGNVLRIFQGPAGVSIIGITRGPNDNVYGMTGEAIWQRERDGVFIRAVPGSASLGNVSAIAWAGNVPEPSVGTLLLMGLAALLRRRCDRNRVV
jgi:hypothetical protein